MNAKCVFILSTKSAGSSALQRRIAAVTGASLAARTRHYENETLFWTKAASVLGLPQTRLEKSEVPIAARRADRELCAFLQDNLGAGVPSFLSREEPKAALFEAWSSLCRAYGPVFLEKSPHHLYQASVVALMREYADTADDVSVHFVGLVRNPMDTLYSSWKRFGVDPAREEALWIDAYRNLRALATTDPARSSVVRYEDLLEGDAGLADLFAFLGAQPSDAASAAFHGKSVNKWKKDAGYGFALREETRALAQTFGYDVADLDNPSAGDWFWKRSVHSAAHTFADAIPKPVRERISRLKRSLAGS